MDDINPIDLIKDMLARADSLKVLAETSAHKALVMEAQARTLAAQFGVDLVNRSGVDPAIDDLVQRKIND